MKKHDMNKVSKTLDPNGVEFIETSCMLTNSDFETIGLSCDERNRNVCKLLKM